MPCDRAIDDDDRARGSELAAGRPARRPWLGTSASSRDGLVARARSFPAVAWGRTRKGEDATGAIASLSGAPARSVTVRHCCARALRLPSADFAQVSSWVFPPSRKEISRARVFVNKKRNPWGGDVNCDGLPDVVGSHDGRSSGPQLSLNRSTSCWMGLKIFA
jgi:hypothetical protein